MSLKGEAYETTEEVRFRLEAKLKWPAQRRDADFETAIETTLSAYGGFELAHRPKSRKRGF